LERPEATDDGIMHNKFVIFDADPTNASGQLSQWICTGSTNLTVDQVNTDANHMVFVQDKSLALAYLIEFEEMWGSSTNVPNSTLARFGEEKKDNTPHEFVVGGNRLQCYFSPSDNTNQKIIDAINTANHDLNIQTMIITRSDLAWAISDAKNRGVETQVLTNYIEDNTTTVNQILEDALTPGKYIFDDVAEGMMHHKMAVIDANYSVSDPQVITGSHNWSNNANVRNDENTLVIHNHDIANQFFQQFAYRFEENGGNLSVLVQDEKISDFSVFPNPSSGRIQIKSGKTILMIQLFNSKGDLIFVNELNTNHHSIDISDRAHGMYLLNVIFENGEQNSYKLIKSR
jgi:phosphatidylserine/phosphatidylglycerophosphate/cardiolipin synthase-like enzyme